MPTYEYKCESCGHAFEKFQSITAPPIKKCPVCGKSKVKRLIGTGAGLIFKGSGFYITDYRSDAYKNSAKSESGTPAETKSGGEGAAADKKPAADAKPAESKTAEAKPSAEPKPASPAKSEPAAKSSSAKPQARRKKTAP